MDDIEELSKDLRKAQIGSLDGFEDFIRVRISTEICISLFLSFLGPNITKVFLFTQK